MIQNPAIQGGAEKVYSIQLPYLDIYGLPKTAMAGEIITGKKAVSLRDMPSAITTEDGEDVPFSALGTTASIRYIHFVAPAKDIKIDKNVTSPKGVAARWKGDEG